MDVSKDTQEKITQLQMYEQNLHSFNSQKRNFQSQMMEIENALKELGIAHEPIFKIVGNVMFNHDKESITKDLKERKEVLDLRIKSLEKQEKSIEEKAQKLQKEVMEEIEKRMKKENGKSN